MSDDFHRPTLTFPDNAYNATQVRLYGIGYQPVWGAMKEPGQFNVGDISITISPNVESDTTVKEFIEENPQAAANAAALSKYLGKDVGTFPYPTKIVYHVPMQTKTFGVVIMASSIDIAHALTDKFLSPGLIVGYSFEGHCYDLPKPKMMLVPACPRPIPVDDCGYDAKTPEHYQLWIVDKLDECVEIDINQGFIEQLVLEANLPGKRSPTMYAGRMQLGHRSGRLTE